MVTREPTHQPVQTQVNEVGKPLLSSSATYMRVIPKVPVKGHVVHHDHRKIISVGLREEMRLIFTDGRLDALVEDPDRSISYIATAKVRSNVMYIYLSLIHI